jgi:mevalonate pyrophosphate decarboxylase
MQPAKVGVFLGVSVLAAGEDPAERRKQDNRAARLRSGSSARSLRR